jgi:hypothetical protein
MFKKGQIVTSKLDSAFVFYSRVSRVFENLGLVEVITCGAHVLVYKPEHLEVSDYKGCVMRNGHFQFMPSLRKLKQMAAKYDKTVWRKNRNGVFSQYVGFVSAENNNVGQCFREAASTDSKLSVDAGTNG